MTPIQEVKALVGGYTHTVSIYKNIKKGKLHAVIHGTPVCVWGSTAPGCDAILAAVQKKYRKCQLPYSAVWISTEEVNALPGMNRSRRACALAALRIVLVSGVNKHGFVTKTDFARIKSYLTTGTTGETPVYTVAYVASVLGVSEGRTRAIYRDLRIPEYTELNQVEFKEVNRYKETGTVGLNTLALLCDMSVTAARKYYMLHCAAQGTPRRINAARETILIKYIEAVHITAEVKRGVYGTFIARPHKRRSEDAITFDPEQVIASRYKEARELVLEGKITAASPLMIMRHIQTTRATAAKVAERLAAEFGL